MRTELLEARNFDLYQARMLNRANSLMREAIDMSIEEPDAGKYTMVAQSGAMSFVGGRTPREQQVQDAQAVRAQTYKLYYENPHARAIIETIIKFVFGKGIVIQPDEKKEAVKQQVLDYLDDWGTANMWPIRQKEIGRRVFREGEAFLYNRDTGRGRPPELQFLEPDQIASKDVEITYGIEMDPKRPSVPLNYYYQQKNGKETPIAASKVVHIKTCVDSTVKRGRSLLEPALPYITMYEDWVKDRMILNKVRSSVALVKTVKGTPGQVTALRQRQADTTRTNMQNRQKMLKPGTIITATEGVEYDFKSPNLQAGDVANDGRAILLAIAAAVGFPEMFLTADYSNANFASTAIAQNPMIREFENWQHFFEIFIIDFISRVLSVAIKNKDLPQSINLKVKIEWPPLIHRDLLQTSQALLIALNSGVLSKTTFAAQLGFDYEEEEELIKTELQNDAETYADIAANAGDTGSEVADDTSNTSRTGAEMA